MKDFIQHIDAQLAERGERAKSSPPVQKFIARQKAMESLSKRLGSKAITQAEFNAAVEELLSQYPVATCADLFLIEHFWRFKAVNKAIEITDNINRERTNLGNDAKQTQKEKKQVKQRWESWQKDPSLYKNQTKFADAMVKEFRHVTNAETVKRWCREWKNAIPQAK